MTCGDNVQSVHKMKILSDTEECVIGYCENCKNRYYNRKRDGRTDPMYRVIYRRDTLQPNSNLYYKTYPERMNVA